MEREEVPKAELEKICWKDEHFIETFGLTLENVMEYFTKSPFYDPTSIYGLLRMQARFNHLEYNSISRSNMTGIDYEPIIASESPLTFIIYKYYRKADSQEVEYLGACYIIDASIYQAPDLYTLIGNRVLGSLYYIQKALDFAQEEVISHPELGRSWNSTEAITLTKESDKLRARLQNTAAVQSGYDSIIQNITTAMVKDVNSDHLYGHAQERRI